jgi:uncharacterized membrane protein YkoI
MTDKIKGIVTALAAVAALAVGGAAIAGATGSDSSSAPSSQESEADDGPDVNEESESNEGPEDNESEAPIQGSALKRASAAALDSTGGGKVTETETGDEESYYEVEVTRDDGSQADVQLDRQFNVVGSESEDANDE